MFMNSVQVSPRHTHTHAHTRTNKHTHRLVYKFLSRMLNVLVVLAGFGEPPDGSGTVDNENM